MKNYYNPSLAQIIGTPIFVPSRAYPFHTASIERRAQRKLVKAIGMRQVKRTRRNNLTTKESK